MKYCRPLTGQRIVTGFVTYTTEQPDSSHHLKSDAGFLQLFSNNMFVLPSAFSETKFCLPAVTNRHPFDISYVCAWYSLQWKPEIQKRYPVPKVIRAAPYETEDEAGSIQHFSFCQIKIVFCSDLVNPPSSTSTCRSTSVQKFSCVCLSVTESHKRTATNWSYKQELLTLLKPEGVIPPARELHCSPNTIKTHINKPHCYSRTTSN